MIKSWFKSCIKYNSGFTLVELMVTIALLGLIITLAGSMINFSSNMERKAGSEFDFQSSMRQASRVLNNNIRNASVTFIIKDEVFAATKKPKWNYLGVENNKEIVEYIWNSTKVNGDGTTGGHDRNVLVSSTSAISYTLTFQQVKDNSNLVQFSLVGVNNNNTNKKLVISSELTAMNSIAVDDSGSPDHPATAIAYRSDPVPNPEEITTQQDVTVLIALVLDKSGSMAWDMEGDQNTKVTQRVWVPSETHMDWVWYGHGNGHGNNGEWVWEAVTIPGHYEDQLVTNPSFNPLGVRVDIMKDKAKALVHQFAASDQQEGFTSNTKICIIPFSSDANSTGDFYDSKLSEQNLITDIDNIVANGGTNTGDGLRRAYYQINSYVDAHRLENKPITSYIILLSDGNPTYYSKTSSSGTTYLTSSGTCNYIGGSGSNDNDGKSMGYIKKIGEDYISDDNIPTFVIAFTANANEISLAKDIVGYCNDGDKLKNYRTAVGSVELQTVFEDIRQIILTDTWHIYGPI